MISAGGAIDASTPWLAAKGVVTSISCDTSKTTLVAAACLPDHERFDAGIETTSAGAMSAHQSHKYPKRFGFGRGRGRMSSSGESGHCGGHDCE